MEQKTYTKEDLFKIPARKNSPAEWGFSADLREPFRCRTNYAVRAILDAEDVFDCLSYSEDCENACSHYYFTHKADAMTFLVRLNEAIKRYGLIISQAKEAEVKSFIKSTDEKFMTKFQEVAATVPDCTPDILSALLNAFADGLEYGLTVKEDPSFMSVWEHYRKVAADLVKNS